MGKDGARQLRWGQSSAVSGLPAIGSVGARRPVADHNIRRGVLGAASFCVFGLRHFAGRAILQRGGPPAGLKPTDI